MTDKELHRLLERSQDEGFQKLFDEYCGYVYSICANKLRGCGTSEDVDECVSDAFAAVFRYIVRSSGQDGDLKGIIGTIARRTAIGYFRRLSPGNGRTVPIDADSFGELPADVCIEDNAEKSILSATVLSCIEALGEPDSSIIVYFYYYGIKTKQIASLVGMSDSAVQQRMSRARKKLKKLLSEAGIEEGYL
jgi:RNA polymerase sigma factor (sigma-70 family)